MVDQFRNLVDDLPGYLAELQARSAQFRELNDRFNVTDQLQGLVGTLPSRLGTGVLGFTSRPAYDPNAFAAGIDRASFSSLDDVTIVLASSGDDDGGARDHVGASTGAGMVASRRYETRRT